MFTYGHWVSDIERPENAKAFVYKVTVAVEGHEKLYIGYKTMQGNRWMKYKTSSKIVKPLWDSVIKAEILEWFDSKEKAYEREIEILTEVDAAFNEEYLNKSIGNSRFNTIGMEFSEEHKKLLAERKIGRVLTEEHKAKLLAAALKSRTADCYKKVSEKLKGQQLTDEHKEKLRLAKLGTKQSSDTISKRAEKNKKRIDYDGEIFIGIKDTSKKLGITQNELRKSISSGMLNGKSIKFLQK